jgi:hypothetical protein
VRQAVQSEELTRGPQHASPVALCGIGMAPAVGKTLHHGFYVLLLSNKSGRAGGCGLYTGLIKPAKEGDHMSRTILKAHQQHAVLRALVLLQAVLQPAANMLAHDASGTVCFVNA